MFTTIPDSNIAHSDISSLCKCLEGVLLDIKCLEGVLLDNKCLEGVLLDITVLLELETQAFHCT